ncbi:MAG: hypothetical protein ABI193_12130, partial [Minicystis sp.]
MIEARAPRARGRLLVPVVALLAACASPPAPPPEQPVIIPTAPPGSAAPPESAQPALIAPPPPAPLRVTRTRLAANLDETTEKAPCDFTRAYRGAIGGTKVSLVIHPGATGGSALVGQSHYDREGDGIELTRTRTGDTHFQLT